MNLPECANQQVCSALFVRLNHTRKLCECSREFNWQCNTLSRSNDGHTIELSKRSDKKASRCKDRLFSGKVFIILCLFLQVYTQIKICEPLNSIRSCRKPTDWTLLALQSERTGKAHYVAVCRCPKNAKLEGPYTHNQPPYARIAGIRVYGMLCTQLNREFRRGKYKNGVFLEVANNWAEKWQICRHFSWKFVQTLVWPFLDFVWMHFPSRLVTSQLGSQFISIRQPHIPVWHFNCLCFSFDVHRLSQVCTSHLALHFDECARGATEFFFRCTEISLVPCFIHNRLMTSSHS